MDSLEQKPMALGSWNGVVEVGSVKEALDVVGVAHTC